MTDSENEGARLCAAVEDNDRDALRLTRCNRAYEWHDACNNSDAVSEPGLTCSGGCAQTEMDGAQIAASSTW